jgi:hypothetical protein
MKSLGVVFNEIDPTSTSSSAKKQASTSSGLQKTHRKTKTGTTKGTKHEELMICKHRLFHVGFKLLNMFVV